MKTVITASLFLLFTGTIFADSPGAPTGLLIEVANNDKYAVVINDPLPEFGWIMNDNDPNEYQTSYRILVASSPELLNRNTGDMWDSGKLESDESSNASYGADGKKLHNGRMYFWKVRLWDKDGNVSPWSNSARFITSLGEQDWTAKPIWDTSSKINEDVADYAYFRKVIKLPHKDIKYAIAFVTSRDARVQKSPSYKFYINDRLVGVGPFQGYLDRVTYNGFDVTGHLKNGRTNVLAALCESPVKEKSFLMQLYIKYEEGDTTIITDDSWKSFNAHQVHNPHGTKTSNPYHYKDPFESIDSRKIPAGWRTIDFDDSGWKHARELHPYYDKLMSVSRPPLEIEEVHPKSVKYLGNGDYDIILGSGYFGWLKLDLNNALPGDTINIRGEQDIWPWKVVDWEDWIISERNMVIEEAGYVWTDSLQIRGYDGLDTLDAGNIIFTAVRNPFDDSAGSFSCSNPLLNEIYDFCKVSMKNLNVDFYWDTPQNERLAYEGGAIIQQMTSYTMDREYALARFASEYQYYEPTWPHEYKMQSVLMAWEDFLYTGNIESIEEHWEIIKSKKYDIGSGTNYLVENIAASALDWPPPYLDGYNYEDGDSGNTFIDNVLNAWNYYSYDRLASLAAYLDNYYPGRNFNAESENFRSLAEGIKENYNRTFYNPDLKRYIDGLNSKHAAFHSSFFPAALGLVPGDLQQDIANYLATRDMDCGVFGSQFFLWSLYKLNLGQKALDLMLSRSKNSWYHVMHELNAANTTEAWDPSGKPDMSKSHAWGGSAGNIIQRGLMGINPTEPGFKHVSIKPRTGNLKYANMELPTIKGIVSVNVSRDGESYNITVNIPANVKADLYIKKFHGRDNEVEADGELVNGTADEEGENIIFRNIGSGIHIYKRYLRN